MTPLCPSRGWVGRFGPCFQGEFDSYAESVRCDVTFDVEDCSPVHFVKIWLGQDVSLFNNVFRFCNQADCFATNSSVSPAFAFPAVPPGSSMTA